MRSVRFSDQIQWTECMTTSLHQFNISSSSPSSRRYTRTTAPSVLRKRNSSQSPRLCLSPPDLDLSLLERFSSHVSFTLSDKAELQRLYKFTRIHAPVPFERAASKTIVSLPHGPCSNTRRRRCRPPSTVTLITIIGLDRFRIHLCSIPCANLPHVNLTLAGKRLDTGNPVVDKTE
jgi:hypothetical protein